MPMRDIEVEWEKAAQDLLRKRDTYTQKTIKEEFAENPTKDAIEFDPLWHYYATPVINKRYTVVWRMANRANKRIANVRAVVPTRFSGDDLERIKTEVSTVVSNESNGAIKLF
jgi:hypothetical protein